MSQANDNVAVAKSLFNGDWEQLTVHDARLSKMCYPELVRRATSIRSLLSKVLLVNEPQILLRPLAVPGHSS